MTSVPWGSSYAGNDPCDNAPLVCNATWHTLPAYSAAEGGRGGDGGSSATFRYPNEGKFPPAFRGALGSVGAYRAEGRDLSSRLVMVLERRVVVPPGDGAPKMAQLITFNPGGDSSKATWHLRIFGLV
jgi:hypothetical protein